MFRGRKMVLKTRESIGVPREVRRKCRDSGRTTQEGTVAININVRGVVVSLVDLDD